MFFMPRQTFSPDKPMPAKQTNLLARARREAQTVEAWIPDIPRIADSMGISTAYVMDMMKDLELIGEISKIAGRRGIYKIG